jgi:hypothetical protein
MSPLRVTIRHAPVADLFALQADDAYGRRRLSETHVRLLPGFPRVERVVPFGTYGVRFNLESLEIFTLHLLPSLIEASVQEALTFNPVAVVVPRMYPNMISRVLGGFPCQFMLM